MLIQNAKPQPEDPNTCGRCLYFDLLSAETTDIEPTMDSEKLIVASTFAMHELDQVAEQQYAASVEVPH